MTRTFADRISSLSPHQLATLKERLRERELSLADLPIPPRDGERDAFPLSFAQERLWFLHQLDPDSASYHIPSANRLRGRLDSEVLGRALNEIVARHESLRTNFLVGEGTPVQKVHRRRFLALPVVDLGSLAAPLRGDEARRLARQQAARTFDLEHDLLLRVCLLRLAPRDHVLCATQHHIVSDAWSFDVLWREIATVYDAFLDGRLSPLEPLAIQYGDFSLWQRQWLDEATVEAQWAYWRERLAGAPPLLELAWDRPRPAVMSGRGALLEELLPAPLSASVKELSRRREVTPFVTLLAAFDVLLAGHSGSRDVCVGSPVAGRDRIETEGLIGFFVNTLVLRTDLSGDPSFERLLARVQEGVIGAQVHADLPFEKLVGLLRPERDLSYTTLFQVLFVLQSQARFGASARRASTLMVSPFAAGGGSAKFDLGVNVFDHGERFRMEVEYSTELFDASTVARLVGHFEAILAAAVTAPGSHLSGLPLLTPAERHQLALEWNDTARSRPPRCVPELFAAQVARTPDAVAVAAEESCLSYAELDRRAGRLARRLRALGVGPEVRVGVAMERSPGLAAALLAVLRAGGAYVPLDPDDPAGRLALIAADSQPAVVLSDGPERTRYVGAAEVRLDGEWPSGPPFAEPAVPPDHPAYVIYTSGSTGRPKGAVNRHRSLHNRLLWMQEACGLGPDDRVLQKTPLSFDVSVWEFFGPLAAGACLVMARPGGHRDPGYLAATLAEQRITTVHFVPSMLRVLLDEPGLEACRNLKRVFAGGEVLPAELRNRFRERLAAPLHNLYGPAEAAIDVTWQPCAAAVPGLSVPIGGPIDNLRLHVLGRSSEPVPLGVPGELYLGGVGLARGYHGAPALTAERFVPDGLASARIAHSGERLYRTGDRVRRLADSRLEFLGRLDFQVKLRGLRIEPGEIEAVLADHPEVREAVVTVWAPDEDPSSTRLVAHVVPETASASALRAFLRERLPESMVPSFFVLLSALPLLPSGKVDRRALPAPRGERGEHAFTAPRNRVERAVAAIWQDVLGPGNPALERVGTRDNFFDLGGNSLLLTQVRDRLQTELGQPVSLLDLFRYPTVGELAEHLRPRPEGEPPEPPAPARTARAEEREIAVVGMAGRFPGARDLDAFWHNLSHGVESVTFFSERELLDAGVDPELLQDPDYVPACAWLEDTDLFDARLFGIAPREAETMDPQQRLFLECAWEALEHAGADPETAGGAIGVFGGVSMNRYWLNLITNPELVRSVGDLQMVLGNDKDYLPTRVSYKLDLKGPSVAVQTACSTSLVASHLACRSLLDGECDLALAGGVSVWTHQKSGYLYQEGGILSPDGHCRAFDAAARGTVSGSGVGIVVLKRLRDAVRDADTIHAVIKGSAINNDGHGKIGFTAPGIEGQSRVIREALAVAGVAPETVSYVETHGSATALGDPIEVDALTRAFGFRPGHTCALGSVKTNVGHLDAAAGVTGLIKTVLALKHRRIPPSLHFDRPNPEIDFDRSPFYVNTELAEWPAGGGPRRAGVSSFGLGGTNVHLVLEEAPEREPSGPSRPWQLLVLSAASETALEAATDRLAAALKDTPGLQLADVAFTTQVGRRRLPFRRVLVGPGREEAIAALAGRRVSEGRDERTDRPVAFLFPGLGDHYAGMARQLYESEPTFRDEVDRCSELLAPSLGRDLRQVLFPADETAPAGRDIDFRRLVGRGAGEAADELASTALAQPAVFVIEVALARLWRSWGVRPEAMLGYSLGEYTAACLADVLSLPDALELVAFRARRIAELPAGAMLAVPLSEDELKPLMTHDLDLAAVNAPRVCVAAGPEHAVARLESRLRTLDVVSQRLRAGHAFHSKMMAPIVEGFRERVRQIELRPPKIPYLSNVTGEWIRDREATDPDYWVRHLCGTVRFAQGLEQLMDDPGRILLEVGPGQALSTAARQHPRRDAGQVALASLRDVRERRADQEFLLNTLGRLWIAGARIDWTGFWRHERRSRLPLPGYPFERRRYWIERGRDGAGPRPSLNKRPDVGEWFSVPFWKPSGPPPASAAAETAGGWLVLHGGGGYASELITRLAEAGKKVVAAELGDGFARLGEASYTIDTRAPEDYKALLEELRSADRSPGRIVHLGALTGEREREPLDCEAMLDRGFYSLLFLAQALGSRELTTPVEIAVVSDGMQRVSGEEVLAPAKATVLGPCLVMPMELENVRCRSIDLPASPEAASAVLGQLLAELAADASDPVVAYRGALRWLPDYEPVRLAAVDGVPARLRPRGVYLLTGGLGGMGLELARYLARSVQARLILSGRSPLPEPEEWDAYLADHGEKDAVSRKLRRLTELEELGAEVLAVQADVCDRRQMAAALARAEERWGQVHGVLHAAGLPGGGLIQLKSREAAARVMAPKVAGTLVLDELFTGRPLDFFVLCSSINAITGDVGQVDYDAANAFQDAYVYSRAARDGRLTVSINWDAWREVGMAAATEVPDLLAEGRRQELRHAIAPHEGVEVLRRVLAAGVSRVVVSTRDFRAWLEATRQWNARKNLELLETLGPATFHDRPPLSTPYAEPNNELEREIAAIWQELLGVAPVGIDDDFLELGGDSLLGLRVVARLRELLRVQIQVGTLFEAPTVARLAAEIGGGSEEADLDRLEEVFRSVESMSEGEAEERLAELHGGDR